MHLTIPTHPPALNTECCQPRTAMACETYQPRYAAFLRTGRTCQPRRMHPYINWVTSMASRFRTEHGLARLEPLPHDEFTAWLDERTRKQVECPECDGLDFYRAVPCGWCDHGFVPDECHPNIWGCDADECLTDEEWEALRGAPAVDFDQTFDDDLPLFAQGGAA